ncbi:MAG TPA: UDP-2,3-diacylglucosamine diphosphatase LpxI [Devosia sp.]|nr:UDP-2,3-diacylglucosamine diphosphatase LpxI [Devosia sp.]
MSRRLTILAGAGALVPEVIEGARAAGDQVQVLPLVERPDLGLEGRFTMKTLPRLLWKIAAFRSTHVTMVGGLRASHADRVALQRFSGMGRSGGLSGDVTVLRAAEKILAMTGAKVVGAESIVPSILAAEGQIAGPALPPRLRADAELALRTARAIGALDIGQAAIVGGGRVVAVEDIAGTDALIARVAGYRDEGLDSDLVLAKALKPHQARVVDRPAIGPDTIRNAARARIAAIIVEAEGAIIIDRAGFEAAANEAGISVFGLRADEY